MRILLILTAALLSGLPEPGLTQASCSGTTSMDATDCASARWQRADAELNQLWGQLKPRADAGGTGSALLAQQRQWLKRRDATCEQELGYGGSLDQAIYYDCMKDLTLQRNAEFHAMLR
ncbi:lysozyme inhibitor LprI family protein [Phaeovulum sp.]|uniref:lysozyme inhibitor LprI family protein n=1 Tax=Phaeovulum sp. TaxID=2934796 RepID=UPI0039E2D493